eukprot:6194312-Pleurochrysis_carterae.AAC.1
MRKANTAVEALRRRAHGEDVDVPSVPTRVLGQELLQPWARGVVWDCRDPARCVPVARSTRETAFPGRRQINRAALREVARRLAWREVDTVNQVGEGGVETRAECDLTTALAAAKAVAADTSGYGGGVGVAPYAQLPLCALLPAAARRCIASAAEGPRARRWHVRGGGLRQAPCDHELELRGRRRGQRIRARGGASGDAAAGVGAGAGGGGHRH